MWIAAIESHKDPSATGRSNTVWMGGVSGKLWSDWHLGWLIRVHVHNVHESWIKQAPSGEVLQTHHIRVAKLILEWSRQRSPHLNSQFGPGD